MCRPGSSQALLQHSSAVTGGHSSPRQDCAVLAGAGETGRKAMGKNCQLLPENCSDNISSQKVTPVSTQAHSRHSVMLRSRVLRGSFLVGLGTGRGSAVVRAWTQPWEAAAGRVHRQHLLCPKCSHLPTTSTTLSRTVKTLNLPSGSFLPWARKHLDHVYPE